MLRDLINNIDIPGATVRDEAGVAALVSPIVDCQGKRSVSFLIGTGTLADVDATFVVLVEEGDAANLSDAAAVADADLVGTEVLAAFTFAEDAKGRKIGYLGTKRYVRCTVTPVANVGSAPIAIIPVVEPLLRPSANPPA